MQNDFFANLCGEHLRTMHIQLLAKIGIRNQCGAKTGQMGGVHLAVNQLDTALLQVIYCMYKSDFGGVIHMGKHGFAKKNLPNLDAI